MRVYRSHLCGGRSNSQIEIKSISRVNDSICISHFVYFVVLVRTNIPLKSRYQVDHCSLYGIGAWSVAIQMFLLDSVFTASGILACSLIYRMMQVKHIPLNMSYTTLLSPGLLEASSMYSLVKSSQWHNSSTHLRTCN